MISLDAFCSSPLQKHFGDQLFPELFLKVKTLEHKSSKVVGHLKALWNKKCRQQKDNCYISEKEFLGEEKGRENHVLLFRGEAQLFKTPGISPVVRFALSHDNFCGPDCNPKNLSDYLEEILSVPLSMNFRLIFSTVLVFDPTTQDWKNRDYNGGLHPLNELPQARGEPASIENETVLTLLTTEHFSPHVVGTLDEAKNFVSLDPWVSLSRDPHIAIQFSHDPDLRTQGRIFIISLPKEKVRKSDSHCQQFDFSLGEILDVAHCNHGESYDHELEVDSYLSLPQNYLLDVLLP